MSDLKMLYISICLIGFTSSEHGFDQIFNSIPDLYLEAENSIGHAIGINLI